MLQKLTKMIEESFKASLINMLIFYVKFMNFSYLIEKMGFDIQYMTTVFFSPLSS